MSQKVKDAATVPGDEGEESDEYDIEEVEEGEQYVQGGDEEEDDEGDVAGAPSGGSSLTALLLGDPNAEGGDDEDEDDDDDDDDDDYAGEPSVIVNNAVYSETQRWSFSEPSAVSAPGAIERSISGTKRNRDEAEEEDGGVQPSAHVNAEGELEGDYGEVDELSEVVTKRARTEQEEDGEQEEEEEEEEEEL